MKASAALTKREEASQAAISLSNGKVSDGSGTEDSGSRADQFTPSEEWLRAESNTALWFTAFMWGFIFLRNQKPPIFDGQAIELFQVSVASDEE